MANEVTVSISGLDQLQSALENLKEKAGTNTVRGAARAGGNVVKQAFADNAPKDTGLLSEHFDVKTRKISGEDLAISALIGPNAKTVIHPQTQGRTAGLPRTARMISFLLEFGTRKMAKHPFLTSAWESSKQRALETVIAYLKEKLGF